MASVGWGGQGSGHLLSPQSPQFQGQPPFGVWLYPPDGVALPKVPCSQLCGMDQALPFSATPFLLISKS